jgi:hypothetical protein
MKVEIEYPSGQSYEEFITAGTARVSQNARRVAVQFKSSRPGKPAGKFTLTHEDAERLAHALLLANSAGDVNPIEFSVGEPGKLALAA